MVAQHVNLVITYFTALWTGNVSRYGLLAAPWNIFFVCFTPRALQFGFGFALGCVCFGFAWDWVWFGLDLLWGGLGLIGRVLGGTWFCVSNLVINLFHGHWQNHQFCETLSKLWSSKIRPFCTGIVRRHSLTRYPAGLVRSQTYT